MSASKPRAVADQLDPADPSDRRLIKRQQNAARQAGREGRDRAKTTRDRADLQAAYDAGAAEAEGGSDEGDAGTAKAEQPQAQKSAPAVPAEAKRRPAQGSASGSGLWNGVNRGSWSSFKPTSPAKPPTRMREAGGFLSGVLLYTVVITYVRYGAAGWKGWLSAKFLNKPLTASQLAGDASGSSAATETVQQRET